MNLHMSHYVTCPRLESEGAILSDACVSVTVCRDGCPCYGGMIDFDRGILVCNHLGVLS